MRRRRSSHHTSATSAASSKSVRRRRGRSNLTRGLSRSDHFDRSFQTGARAKPVRPEVDIASDVSSDARADGVDLDDGANIAEFGVAPGLHEHALTAGRTRAGDEPDNALARRPAAGEPERVSGVHEHLSTATAARDRLRPRTDADSLYAADRRISGLQDRRDRCRHATAPARRHAADVRPEGRSARRGADVARDEDDGTRGRDAGIDGASELADEGDVDPAIRHLGVEPADDMRAWATELVLDAGPRHARADGNGDPGARDRNADHQAVTLVRGLRGGRPGHERTEPGEDQQFLHGTRLNKSAESAPPAIRNAAAPPAK